MAIAKLTLIGLYNYMNESDTDLFLHLALPTGIDKETVINNIMLRGGEFEVLYSDPYFLRDSIITWSKKWYWTFDRWLKAINVEYNPLENYDRYEEWSEDNTKNQKRSGENSSTFTDNTSYEQSGVNTDENLVSAFDSSIYQPHEKNQATNQSSGSNHIVQQNVLNIDEGTADTGNIKHLGHLHGNIGVTTSQQMLESEIEVAKFNLYNQIADVFLQEYVLPIY